MDSTLIFYSNTKEHTVVFNTISERYILVHQGKNIGNFQTAAAAIEYAYDKENGK